MEGDEKAEYILLIKLTIHLDTHTHETRKLKRTSKAEYLIYNLYETKIVHRYNKT